MKVAYYASGYPSRSHTFIRREIAQLRKHGMDIKVFSTHKCQQHELLSDLDRDAYNETWSINPINVPRLLFAHCKALYNPLRYAKSMMSSYKHRLPGAKNALWSVFYFIEAIYLVEELKKHEIKHIHVQFANPVPLLLNWPRNTSASPGVSAYMAPLTLSIPTVP